MAAQLTTALMLVLLGVGSADAAPATGTLRLPKVIDSGMVLQRAPKSSRLWGWAATGSTVTITIDDITAGLAKTAADGTWSVELAPQDPSFSHTVKIATSDGGFKTLSDVAFGDVFVCSGQSHMTFSVNQDMDGKEEIASSGNLANGLRMLTVNSIPATTPSDDIASVKYRGNSSWLYSEPASFGTADFGYPSAICYYFAKNLYLGLNGTVPVGIIMASVGGSAIEFWQSDAARADKSCGGLNMSAACPPGARAAEGMSGTGTDAGVQPIAITADSATADAAARDAGWTPSCFYNGMLHPLGNFAITGFLWDQGEANNADDCGVYGCKLAAFAHDLRANLFKQQDILFSFDQLRADPFAAGLGMVGYTSIIPHSMYSSRVDLQTCLPSDTSEGHAIRKLEVGRRLALAALVEEYGEPASGLSYGPTIAAVDVKRSQDGPAASKGVSVVTISFNYSEGLHHADLPDCPGCCDGKNAFPNLIQGTPATGDAWRFVLSDGTTVGVCKNTSGGTDCDGKANILRGTVELNVILNGKTIDYVLYGGTGPWLSTAGAHHSANSADGLGPLPGEKCVYPHQPRYGLEACALYNGAGGFDDHEGIAMPPQWFVVPSKLVQY